MARTRTTILVRGIAGHSIIDTEVGVPYTPEHPQWANTLIHGTYRRHWDSIRQKGLLPAGERESTRSHTHLMAFTKESPHDPAGTWRGRRQPQVFIHFSAEDLYANNIEMRWSGHDDHRAAVVLTKHTIPPALIVYATTNRGEELPLDPHRRPAQRAHSAGAPQPRPHHQAHTKQI